MSWRTIARKDFSDVIRSKKLWVIIAIFGIVTIFSVYLPKLILNDPALVENPEKIGYHAAFEFAKMLVPITALVASYLSITGEKESKSIKILLGLGNTRGEVVLGKLISRNITVIIGVLIGFLTSIIITLVIYGASTINQLILIALLSSYLGFAYVGIGLGISMSTKTRKRSIIFSTASFILLTIIWREIPSLISMITPGTGLGALKTIISVISPTIAYDRLGSLIFQLNPGYMDSVFVSKWFLLGIIFAWGIIPIILGYFIFRKEDLD